MRRIGSSLDGQFKRETNIAHTPEVNSHQERHETVLQDPVLSSINLPRNRDEIRTDLILSRQICRLSACELAAQYDVSKERWQLFLLFGIMIQHLEDLGIVLIKVLIDALSDREDRNSLLALAVWITPEDAPGTRYFHTSDWQT